MLPITVCTMPSSAALLNPLAPLVELKSLCYQSGKKVILDQINLQLIAGDIVTLIGPKGAGKSTLVKLILGLLKPTAGSIYKQAGLRIGYMPQQLTLPSTMPMSVHQFLSLTQSDPQLISHALADCGVEGGRHVGRAGQSEQPREDRHGAGHPRGWGCRSALELGMHMEALSSALAGPCCRSLFSSRSSLGLMS